MIVYQKQKDSSTSRRLFITDPAQDSLKNNISFLEKKLIFAIEGRDSGLARNDVQKEINRVKKINRNNQKKLIAKEKKNQSVQEDTGSISKNLSEKYT